MTMSLFDLTGRTALVTGSSRGLGLALATGLLDAGAKVILHGSRPETVAAAADQLHGRGEIATVSFDVTDAAAAEAAVSGLIAEHGVPDILVNNAGVQRRGPITEVSVADWDAVIATNLSSAFYVARLIARGMAERGSGKIVNIGSVASKLGRSTIAPYGASEAGIAMLSQAMTADLTPHGVQVNTLSPGYFATEMNTALINDEKFSQWVCDRTPAGRWGEVEELVGTLIFLSSRASDFVSGQNISVDGGLTAVV